MMNTQQLLSIHEQLSNESREIMEKKNHDYSGASGDPFANFRGAEFLGIHPVLGMQLRQQDKMMRVRTFVNKGQLAVKSESVKDAIIDQINYLVLQYAFIVASTEGENKNDTRLADAKADLAHAQRRYEETTRALERYFARESDE